MSIIAKYKFDSSIYTDLIPEFNAEFTSDLYTVTDEVDSTNSNHIIRTIESDELPTLMRFGTIVADSSVYVAKASSLLEILNMDTSALTTMQMMFFRCNNVSRIDCDWVTSGVTNMYAAFSQCNNLTILDVSNFNTSNVINMAYMFYNCTNLTSLDVSNFDTSNVTNMSDMFNNCTNLTTLDVSNWDTSNVTDMGYMFNMCTKLTTIGNVSNWNTSKVKSMTATFGYCYALTSLDVSNWDTSNSI